MDNCRRRQPLRPFRLPLLYLGLNEYMHSFNDDVPQIEYSQVVDKKSYIKFGQIFFKLWKIP